MVKNKCRLILLFLFISSFIFFFEITATESIDNVYGGYYIEEVEKTVSMDLEDVPLMSVIRALSEQTGLNFIATENVEERNITVYLDKVPLDKALDVIFKANGLAYDYFDDSKVFVVKDVGKPEVELVTKVFYLKYVRVGSGFSDSGSGESEDGGDDSAVGSSSGSNGSAGLENALKHVMSEDGKVASDANSNSLIVKDFENRFPAIEEMISKLDVPSPRILIEVEVVDVDKRVVDTLGVTQANGLTASISSPEEAFTTSFPFPSTYGTSLSCDSVNGKTCLTGVSSVGVDISSILTLLSSRATTKFLARPRILTLSNETAQIKISTNEAIGTRLTTTGEETNVEIERAETGTILDVTPWANMNTRDITLKIKTTVKETKASAFTSSDFVSGQVQDPEERTAESVIRVSDGETVLMGGLIRNKDSANSSSIPFFRDIPFLGALFRGKDNDVSERELLVFITPHIVDETSALANSDFRGVREQSLTVSRAKNIEFFLDNFESN